MDPGRFALKQGWDSNSALEGYSAVHEPDFRTGSSYGARRFLDDGFPRDPVYARTAFHRDILERDAYPHPPPVSGIWPQPRRSYDEEYALIRDPRRHVEPFHEMENFHDEKYRDISSFQDADRFRDNYHSLDGFRDTDSYRDYGFDRHARFFGRDSDDIGSDHYGYRNRIGREDSRDRDYDADRYNPDSDHERGRRDSSWRRREPRDREREKRGLSREKDPSPYKRYERSRSRGREDRSRSRSPRARSRARSHREESYDDGRYERSDKRRDLDRDDKRHSEPSVAPSATVVVKGLSQKTTEEDLCQILAEWGPLRHVRVIKERNSGVSRGFAFIDFPTVEAARNMMEGIGDNCPVIDGRKLFFEYSSKPTGGAGAPSLGSENSVRSGHGPNRSTAPPSDWMCTICGCVNFARRTSCFQCNEGRTDDAPPADVSTSNPTPLGRKGPEAGPTHVLVVRGLDENADEDMLRYEFSKHAPIKDLRLVRDKFTHVSRGFAFVHFHSVEDATKALDATNGTTLEKNGQTLRVAYAKSIHGPSSGASQSSSLAAAAIEAAAFAQQYDSVGWAPKEYNAKEKRSTGGLEQNASGETTQNAGLAPQSGFIWDEKSGYYYDAGSGFYYDGNTGLYYDGNNGIWYSYDHQSQQYVPCTDQSNSKTPAESTNETSKASDGTASKKVIISAPAITTKSNEKASLPDAVQAAATAALAAEKKEKEKMKEIKLASKNSLLANKKKMSNFLTTWKQRNNEGQTARVVLDDNNPSSTIDDKQGAKTKMKYDDLTQKETAVTSGFTASGGIGRGSSTVSTTSTGAIDSQTKARPVSNSLGGTIMGVIRGSGRGVIKADTTYTGSSSIGAAISSSTSITSTGGMSLTNPEAPAAVTPFKTDVSALGSYAQPVPAGSGKRRFSEMPVQSITHVEQPQTTYRDRAAERWSLYGSSSSIGDGMSNPDRDYPYRKGSSSEMGAMPFPPGVGGGRAVGDTTSNTQQFEVITADRALDESNVGNRMLRSMGWQEGLGLGKDGSGIKEPVQAKAVDDRSGLGSQQRRASDPLLEAQAGDSYRTIIQKKAIARFREMS